MYTQILVIALIMLAIDIVYLKLASNHFKTLFLKVQNKPLSIKYGPALLCYIIMVFGLYYFVVKENKPLYDAFLLGLVIYGVYDTTNMTTLVAWDWKTVFLDSTWGATLFTMTYYLTKQIA